MGESALFRSARRRAHRESRGLCRGTAAQSCIVKTRRTRRAQVLPLIEIGDPVLRRPARQAPTNPLPHRLIADLIRTVRAVDGVGIAAPQVGVGIRLFIIASRPNVRYPKAPDRPPFAMINPVLIAHSRERVKGWEGCLSVPRLRGLVPRYRWVRVRYTSADGRREEAVLEDFMARIFQHEFDHIEGMIFVDRVEDSRSFMTDTQFRQRILKLPAIVRRKR